MSDDELVYERGVWRFVWRRGRLADVYHVERESALACIQVGEWDYHAGRAVQRPGRDDLVEAAERWIEHDASDYLRELPYL